MLPKHSKYKYTYYQNTVNTSTHITKILHTLHKGVSEFAALFYRFG